VLILLSVNPVAISEASFCYRYFNHIHFEQSETERTRIYFEAVCDRAQVVRHLVIVVVLVAELEEELICAYQLLIHVVVHHEKCQIGRKALHAVEQWRYKLVAKRKMIPQCLLAA
jgi:hypothetical protein